MSPCEPLLKIKIYFRGKYFNFNNPLIKGSKVEKLHKTRKNLHIICNRFTQNCISLIYGEEAGKLHPGFWKIPPCLGPPRVLENSTQGFGKFHPGFWKIPTRVLQNYKICMICVTILSLINKFQKKNFKMVMLCWAKLNHLYVHIKKIQFIYWTNQKFLEKFSKGFFP